MSICTDYVALLLQQAKEIKFEDRYKGISSNPIDVSTRAITNIMTGHNFIYSDGTFDKDPFYKTHKEMYYLFGKFKTYTVERTINCAFHNLIPEGVEEKNIEKEVGNQIREVANGMLNELGDPKLLLIGLKEVFGSIAEISDVINNSNIKPNMLKKLQDEHGNYYARWNQYAKVIGLQYLKANGKRISDSKANEQLLIDTGNKVLDLLAKYGYITKHEGDEYKIALNKERVFNEETQEYEYKKSESKEEYGIHTIKKAFTVNNEKISNLYMLDKTNPEQVYKTRNKLFGGRNKDGKNISGILKYYRKKIQKGNNPEFLETYYVLKEDYNGDGKDKASLTSEEKLWLENYLLYDYVAKLSKTFIPQNITHIRHKSIFEDKNEDGISTEEKLKKESDMSLDGNIEEATKELEKKPYFLDKTLIKTLMPFVRQLLEEYSNMNEYDIHSFLQQKKVQTFLGIAPNEYNIPKTKEEVNSKSGSDRTKVDNFMQLVTAIVDDIIEYGDENEIDNEELSSIDVEKIYNEIFSEGAFYIGKKRGRNARTYLMEVAINPEIDKHFTRHFTNVSNKKHEVTILDKNNKLTDDFNYVITHFLNEVVGIKHEKNPKFVHDFLNAFIEGNLEKLNKEELSAKQKELINLIEVYVLSDKKEEELITNLAKVYNTRKSKTKVYYKPIDRLQIFKFAQEYKEYKNNKNNTFKTNISPEADANSSGITIKIIQEAAYNGNKQARHLLWRFGMVPNENGEFIKNTDPEYLPGAYELVMETMDNFLSDNIENEEIKNSIQNNEEMEVDRDVEKISKIQKLFDNHNDIEDSTYYGFKDDNNKEDGYFTLARKIWNEYADKIGISKRDMSKYPTMIIGAYNMAVGPANKENVVKPMYKEFKSAWLAEPKLFQEYLKMIKDTLGKDALGDLKLDNFILNPEPTTKDVAEYLTNKNIEFAIKNQIEQSIGKMLSIVAYNEFKYKLFNEDNKILKETFNEYQEVYKNNTSMYKIADLNLLNSNEDLKDIYGIENTFDNMKWNNTKNYLKLLKQVEVWNKDTETTSLVNIPNINTLVVSTIHMYDSSILHDAILNTKQRIKGTDLEEEFNNTNILTIHDAVILSPKLYKIFQEEYIAATSNLINKFPKRFLILGSFLLNINRKRYNTLWKRFKEEFKIQNPKESYIIKSKEFKNKKIHYRDDIFKTIYDSKNSKLHEWDIDQAEPSEEELFVRNEFKKFTSRKRNETLKNQDLKDKFIQYLEGRLASIEYNKIMNEYIKTNITNIMQLDTNNNNNNVEELGFESQEELNLFNSLKEKRDQLKNSISKEPVIPNDSKDINKITGKIFGDPLVEYTHKVEQDTSKEPNGDFRKILHKKTLEAYQNILNSEPNKIQDIIKNIIEDQTKASDKNGIDLNKLQNIDKIVKYLNENGNGFYNNEKAIKELKKYMFIEPNKVIKFNSEPNMSINQNKNSNYDQAKGLANKLLYLHTLNIVYNDMTNKSEPSEEEIDKQVDDLHEFAKTHTFQEVIDKINEDISGCRK